MFILFSWLYVRRNLCFLTVVSRVWRRRIPALREAKKNSRPLRKKLFFAASLSSNIIHQCARLLSSIHITLSRVFRLIRFSSLYRYSDCLFFIYLAFFHQYITVNPFCGPPCSFALTFIHTMQNIHKITTIINRCCFIFLYDYHKILNKLCN